MIKQGKGLQAYLLEEAEYVSSTDAQTASENPTTKGHQAYLLEEAEYVSSTDAQTASENPTTPPLPTL